MRVVDAGIGGAIVAGVTLLIVRRLAIAVDRVTLTAVIFLVVFVAVLLRPYWRGDR